MGLISSTALSHFHFYMVWSSLICSLISGFLCSQSHKQVLCVFFTYGGVAKLSQIIKLHTTKQRKFAILGVFLLAFMYESLSPAQPTALTIRSGLGASIARMVVYIQVETGTQISINVSPYY